MFPKNKSAGQNNQLFGSKALSLNNKIQVRLLKKKDSGVLLKWANDQETRHNSCSASFINKAQHKKWFKEIFKKRFLNPALICLRAGRSRVGVIRFTRPLKSQSKWEIHFTVSPRFRGQGLARPMLKSAIEWFGKTRPNVVVYAKVKKSNFKSLKTLESIGFKKKQSFKNATGLVVLLLSIKK